MRRGASPALRTALLSLLACAPLAAEPARGEGGTSSRDAAPPAHAPYEDAVPAGPSVEARLDAIRARVQAVARYPDTARLRGVTGEVRVAFEIEPDGRPANVRVARSSGSLALDRAAERAVHEAGALPRVIGPVQVPVRFALVESR